MVKEVDLAVGPFTITADRKEVVDFLTPIWRERLTLLMRKPEHDAMESMLIIFKPFKWQVISSIFSTRNY